MPSDSFDEVLLSPDYSPNTQGGPGFMTDVVVVTSGKEVRQARWERPLSEWTIGYDALTTAEYEGLVEFFIARRGRHKGFRFLDWADGSSAIAGIETKHDCLEVTTTTFQLRKIYTSGGVAVPRYILKPVADTLGDTSATQANSTVRIYDAGGTEVLSGWSVNTETGIVTFLSAPGYVPKATFEFHVPVRFSSDSMKAVQPAPTYRQWNGIGIQEIKLI